ncbi:hypothetical protein AAE478_003756 [Parahypoxylon ruwenzoriense]
MAWIGPVIGKSPSFPGILAATGRNSQGMVSVLKGAVEGIQYLVGDRLAIAICSWFLQFLEDIKLLIQRGFSQRKGKVLILGSMNGI